MTVEIAVMNKMGVALASDSAVTIGPGQKIFNSANKLFMLSKYQPVGIMIYNNASFVGYPWELLIKEYRAHLDTKAFDRIEDYGRDFINWVKSTVSLMSERELNVHTMGWIHAFFESVREQVQNRLNSCDNASNLTEEKVRQITEHAVLEIHTNLSNEDFRDSCTPDVINKLKVTYTKAIDDMVLEMFPEKFFTENALIHLRSLPFIFITKNVLSPASSGIVIAGYGSKDLFPSIVEYDVDGYFLDWLRYSEGKISRIGTDTGALVKAYAQGEMIRTFVEGVDPDYDSFMHGFVNEALYESYPDAIATALNISDNTVRAELIRRLREVGQGIIDDFAKTKDEYKQQVHVGPVLGTISVLPKDELAAAAETLVNLTSFKRRVSPDSETVGGPVDVCVISKNDGFVWIKRKHYFRPELNSHFFANYYNVRREVRNEKISESTASEERSVMSD